MKLRTGTVVVLGAAVLALLTLATAGWGRYLAQPGPLQAPAMVVIDNGNGPRTIAAKLQRAGVIDHPEAFVLAVRLLGLAGTLQAGEYSFDPGISLRATINKLALGDTQNRAVTIPEGFTVAQVLARLEADQGLSGKIEQRPAEGTLFPDTYAFRFGVKRQDLLGTMSERMAEELAAAWASRTPGLPLNSPEELLILASIVQKEAANDAEMPQIAGVFVNRLNRKMKLQSDPTVIYGANFDGNIRKKDLSEPHPFNTYVYAGLPPTPIANPGRAALRAAAQPATTPALFFVADPSRTHHLFAESYAEHQRNVQRYWRTVQAEQQMIERQQIEKGGKTK
ncbi:MAG: endolytic transglycosylase MltG [Alphaproteobacteria bacterium]|nr:endolytic transglycosylase MltG [Alphaproteobacteria bacterium]